MNWWAALLVLLLTPVVIIGGWLLVVLISDAIRGPGPQVCRCGRHVIADSTHLHDQDDGHVHSRGLCQPIGEWISPWPESGAQ